MSMFELFELFLLTSNYQSLPHTFTHFCEKSIVTDEMAPVEHPHYRMHVFMHYLFLHETLQGAIYTFVACFIIASEQ